MGSSLTLGRIAGIRVGVHWSWLVVFALLVWTLATGVFERTPISARARRVAVAVVAAVLFFASVLLHELGHAFQARREQIEIEGITLWLFGGVARSRRVPERRRRVPHRGRGPLVSLALGVLFVALALAGLPESGRRRRLARVRQPEPARLQPRPAVPLDGGRILHAALWRFRGDFGWATRIGGARPRVRLPPDRGGVAMFVFAGSFSGAWLVFLGWFLLAAASGEARYLAAREALTGLRVRDLMSPTRSACRPG